jgi:hypothetical protein
MLGSKSAATSAPVSLSWPERMPTAPSRSSGEPNATYCGSCASRNSRFVVSSNRRVMWSSESGVPYRLFASLLARNARARRETKTEPAKMPGRGQACGHARQRVSYSLEVRFPR